MQTCSTASTHRLSLTSSLFTFCLFISLLGGCGPARTQTSYSNFKADLEEGKVVEVVITGNTAFVTVIDDPQAVQQKASSYEVTLPQDPAQRDDLTKQLQNKSIPFEVRDH